MINIGGDQSDPNYRYKMPRLQAKVEGSGNGIKTAVPNMVDIARALHTDEEYPTKYFGIELGAQSKFDRKTDRAIVNGKHDASVLQGLLTKFINTFILCPNCKLPELNMEVRMKAGIIKIDCRSCGYNGPIKSGHKLCSFILTHPPAKKKKSADKDKKKGSDNDEEEEESASGAAAEAEEPEEKKEPAKKKEEIREDNVEWFSDVSREAAAARKEAELSEFRVGQKKSVDAILESGNNAAQETPRTALRNFLASSNNRAVSDITSELRRLQIARGLDEWQRMLVLIQAVVDTSKPKSVPEQFKKNVAVFKALATDNTNRLMIINAIGEVVAVIAPKCLSVFPHILQTFYEEDVLLEENITSWHESPPEADRLSSKKASADLRRAAVPLIDWFKNAEEESEEDDDDN